jgi:2-keto-4-pentenoate hydratase
LSVAKNIATIWWCEGRKGNTPPASAAEIEEKSRGTLMAADAGKIAETLMREHTGGTPFQPFAAACGIVTADDAYAVQRQYVRLLVQSRGTKAAGYKIGLTTPRMQAMCGIDSPVAGVVLKDRVHASGARIKTSAYGRAGLEFEIAVRLGKDLVPAGQPPGIADVAAVVDGVCPAIEIIDDRNSDYRKLDALSLIADNAWNGGIVLGSFTPSFPDLAIVEAVVSEDGKIVDRGFGRDVLGHPFNSVAWLATHLAAQRSQLRAGDIVMTGSVVTTKFPDRSTSYHYELTGCGAVDLFVEP